MSRQVNITFFVGITLICFCINSSFAFTFVEGAVRGHWTVEEHPYFANEAISVLRSDTLIIDPGVEVLFDSGKQFDVYGTVIAMGTERDSIIFRAQSNEVGDWIHLRFDGAGSSGSVLSHCIVTQSVWGLYSSASDPVIEHCRVSNHFTTCGRLENSRARISHSTFSNCEHDGITISENSRAEIRHCKVFDCQSNGIIARNGSNPIIEDVEVHRVTFSGIHLSDAGPCSLKYNTLIDCNDSGISLLVSNGTTLFKNIIYHSSGDYAVNIHRCNEVEVINNTIFDNSGVGLRFNQSTGSIVSNIVAQNGQDGIYVRSGDVRQMQFNDVWTNGGNDYAGTPPGYDDISENPQLNDPARGDFVPREGSPVIDAGSPRNYDPDGTRSDIGAKFFNQNHAPTIDSFYPEDFSRIEGEREIEFGVSTSDPDGHPVEFTWWVDNRQVGDESSFTYLFDFNHRFRVTVVVDDGYCFGQTSHTWRFEVFGTDVPDDNVTGLTPENFSLSQPYPNPFNEMTRLNIYSGVPGVVNLAVVNLNGRRLQEQVIQLNEAGDHPISFNSKELPAGTAFVIAEMGGIRSVKKLVVLK